MLSPSGFAYCSASRLQELSKTGRGCDPRPITKSSATLDEKRAYKLMSHLDARMQHGYTGHVPKRAGDEAQQEDLLNASCTKTGVLGYKGYRVGQRERMGQTYMAWADPARAAAAEREHHAPHAFDDGSERSQNTWSHSKRVLRQKKTVEVEVVPEGPELETQYRRALEAVGGEGGVQRLVLLMAAALVQHNRSRTEVEFQLKRAFSNADVDGSGLVDRAELRRFVEMINCVLGEHQIVALMAAFDKGLCRQIDTSALQQALLDATAQGFLCSSSNERATSLAQVQGGGAAGAAAAQSRERVGGRGERELRLATGDLLVRAAAAAAASGVPPGGWVLQGQTVGPVGARGGAPTGQVLQLQLTRGEVLFEAVGSHCYALRAHALVAAQHALAQLAAAAAPSRKLARAEGRSLTC